MADQSSRRLQKIANYYTKKLEEFGENAKGVDWNGEEGQILRFEQLYKMIDETKKTFSINDLGCGYGAFLDYINTKHKPIDYLGIDISKKMIETAKKRFHGSRTTRFIISNKPDRIANYGIASGIFNVKGEETNDSWQKYILGSLRTLNDTSKYGFAFNCLTHYSDKEKMRSNLFYADPCFLFDYCKKHFAKNVALLHDYGLYEFTFIIRKDA